MTVNFNIQLSDSQQEAYDLVENKDYKYYAFAWSRQSGKSVLMQVLCLKWLLQKNNTIAYICRNYLLAKKIYREIARLFPEQFIAKVNGSDFYIESTFGSTLTFFSAESGASLRGLTISHMILDEFAFFKFEQTDGSHLWNDILSPTLKAKGKKCIFVSTPLGKQNMFYDMYMRGLDKDFPEYISVKKTIYDDGFVTEEQIKEIQRTIPDLSFRQEYLTEFMDGSGTFFKGFEDCFTDYEYNNSTRQWIGVDLSSGGKDATVLTRINELNQTESITVAGSLDEKYRKIASLIDATKNLQVAYLENNGVGSPMINEIRKLTTNKSRLKEWTTTNSSKERIVSNLAVAIANKDITFNNDDTELFVELANFGVKYTKTGKMQFEGVNSHDDKVMSLAIALQCKEDHKLTGNNITFVKTTLNRRYI